MVIFCDDVVEKFVWKHRNASNTRIVRKTLDDLRAFPFYAKVQEIRTDEAWLNQAGWLRDSTQAKLEFYNPLVMSKQFFLNDASLYNFFDTKYFLWVDAGLANTVNLPQYFTPELESRIVPRLNKMLYLCFPYDGQCEVHGFKKSKMNEYAGQDTTYVARGGVFGGTKEAINAVNEIYYSLLSKSLGEGLMGTEESIFTLISYTNPELVNKHMIENNGLVYKFFEDIFSEKVQPIEQELAFYVLTYNLPQQLKLWVASMKKAYPSEFDKAKKYLINNSTDPTVSAAYQKIIDEHGFIEFKFDNIGICDGRHFAAEHFDKAPHRYYVFFEDDMLVHEDEGTVCKSGFTTYQKNLFDKAIDITRNESLDYLKLSFSEVYGTAHENWGWHNVPSDLKQKLFPGGNKKTKIEYTGTLKGTPFAVGEYHYCNWPILFTKEGNRKVFLETQFEHKYEQTWMSYVCQQQKAGKIKAGCLLASPINHFRKYFYKKRKENKHG